jgi:hypothetical protein
MKFNKVLSTMNAICLNNRFAGWIPTSRTYKAFLFAIAIISLFHAKVQGNDGQQVWLISTRCAPVSGDLQSGSKAIRYWRLSSDRQWQDADAESFQTMDEPAVPTTVIVHGNDDNADDAIQFAWPVYCRMLKIAQDKPFRLVIWSWPSDRVCKRIRSDVQLKYSYCDAQAYYLAETCKLHLHDRPLCLIGYSMGAQIAAAGLHLLAGGEVDCRKLDGGEPINESQNRSIPVRVVMVAAAMDNFSLASDGEYNLALPLIKSMLLARNGCDRVLKWYPRLYGRGGPQALGFTGPTGCGEYDKIELLDVSCEVGRKHPWEFYIQSASLMAAIDRYAFLDNTIGDK